MKRLASSTAFLYKSVPKIVRFMPAQELKSRTGSFSFSWNQDRRLFKLLAILNNAFSAQLHEDGEKDPLIVNGSSIT
jgi:hypothetical protein